MRHEGDNSDNGLGCAVLVLIAILILALIGYSELSRDDFFYQKNSLYENIHNPSPINKLFEP